MDKKVQITATILPELRDQINDFAQKDSRTFSQTVALLLEYAIKEKTRKRTMAKGLEGSRR